MKLSAFVAIAAVIGGSFLIPVPAEARNGWMKGGCEMDGGCYYQKVISKNWPYVTFKSNTPYGPFTEVADCQQWRKRYSDEPGRWKDVMPGSIGEANMRNVCR